MLLLDGSFGTYYKLITNQDTSPELANINNKNTVLKIHNEYINAGCTAISTNTFAANSSTFNSKEDISTCIIKGYEIAKTAAKGQTKVYADIGYIYGSTNEIFEKDEDEYIFIADTFLNLGAENFLFETFGEYEVIKPAIKYIRQHKEKAHILLSFAVSQDGLTFKGLNYVALIKEVHKDNLVNGTGLNCICGPAHTLHLLKSLKQKEPHIFNNIALMAMPNSGYPSRVGEDYFYENNSTYFAKIMTEISELGVSILGGCCGTYPIHLEKMIKSVIGITERKTEQPKETVVENKKEESYIERSILSTKLKLGEKPIAIELDPPINTETEYLITSAKELKARGADVITVADSPLARTRACSFLTASKIYREASIEVMPHLTCRDKNNIGISATLLGGAIDGINNVLCITGDPTTSGTKGVFSFNSFGLIEYIDRMNNEYFTSSPYFIGGALNTSAPNFKNELTRAIKKEQIGANFFMTQPIYSRENIENLIKAKNTLKNAYILAGILPFSSYKNALFLNNEVSGIDIPEDIIESLEGKTPEEVKEISISYSLDIIDKVYDVCDGFYIMIPLKRTDIVLEIIDYIKHRRQK